MKKIICLALAVILCGAFMVSCSNTGLTSGTAGNGKDTSASTTPVEWKDHKAPKADELDMTTISSLDGVTESTAPTNYVLIKIANYGDIVVRLYPEVAPVTVKNFKNLVSQKFYDGLIFHRVISGFMIQGGDPLGTGTGGSKTNIVGEFASNGFENNLHHERGVVAMARSGDPNSASSQFYICHKNSQVAHLDGSYASFGYVVYGIEVVDAIAKVNTDSNDKPLSDVVITSIRFVNVALEK